MDPFVSSNFPKIRCDKTHPKTFLVFESFNIPPNDKAQMISRDLMLIIAIPSEVPTSNIGPGFRISVVTGNKKINIFFLVF